MTGLQRRAMMASHAKHCLVKLRMREMLMKITKRSLLAAIVIVTSSAVGMAQNPPPKQPPAPKFWVTTTAWVDGAEIPMRHAVRGDNKSPAFEFRWNLGTNPGTA